MSTSQIQASCRGASNGKAWHESYKKGALMDHFAATLDKVNCSSLESKMKKLRQAGIDYMQRRALPKHHHWRVLAANTHK